MQQLTALNSREVKEIRQQMLKEYGHFPLEDYAYLQSEKDRVFIVTKDIAKVDFKKLIVDRVGLYFAELKKNHVRLSKEGAQLLVLDARINNKKIKNLVELEEEEVKHYFQGLDLEKDLGGIDRLIILSYHDNIIGCAQYKEKKILNFLPKLHRGEVIL